MKTRILYSLILLVTFLFGYICAGKIYFNKFISFLNSIVLSVTTRLDKALIGNDGFYSHTRIINLTWGLGGFWLVCFCAIREIRVPGEILILMGGAMGISGIQSVANKINELKYSSNQSNTQTQVVDSGDKNA